MPTRFASEEWYYQRVRSIPSDAKKSRGMRNFYEVIQLGEVVHMDLACRDGIWENIISKNRI